MIQEFKESPRMIKVKFIEEWLGNPKGTEKTIMSFWAKDLLLRKIVVFAEEHTDKTDKKEEKVSKILRRAPKDKMIKQASDK